MAMIIDMIGSLGKNHQAHVQFTAIHRKHAGLSKAPDGFLQKVYLCASFVMGDQSGDVFEGFAAA